MSSPAAFEDVNRAAGQSHASRQSRGGTPKRPAWLRAALQVPFELITGMPILWLVRWLGYGGSEPLWLLTVLLVITTSASRDDVRRWLAGDGGTWRRHLPIAVVLTTSAGITYALGWGPVLIPGCLPSVASFLTADGSRLWTRLAAWIVGVTAAGQTAVAQGWVDSYIKGSQVHIVALMMLVVTLYVVRVLGLSAAGREHAELELRLSESRFRSLSDRSFDGTTVIGADRRISYVSPSSERLTGIPNERMLGSDGMDLVHPEDAATAQAVLSDVLTLGPDEHRTVEVRMLHGDEDYHWHEIVLRNLLTDPAVTGIVANNRDISERHRSQAALEFDATHDSLTGLPNRALFLQRINAAIGGIRPGSALGVLFIDLDRFKQVNDSLGHDAGDQLLMQAASRLQAVLRPGDVLARLGGDEFTVLMPDVADPATVFHAVDQMQATLLEPFPVAGTEATVGASIGIVVVDDAGEDAEAILRHADMAMYRAKKGTSRFEVFDDTILDETIVRTETERALRTAIESDQLRAWFQPVVDLESGAVTGAESLLRWDHPTRGVLVPSEFLPLAESTGLIVAIGERLLRLSLEAAATWPPHLTVAINMSSQQLAAPGLVELVTSALDETGVAPSRLWIEVLESHVLQTAGVQAVEGLRALGVTVAIDDFGAGYRTLSFLQMPTVDIIKIDRRFVEGIADSPIDLAVVTKIVELAHALDIGVVAEGVETLAQYHALHSTGCDWAQGHRWSVAVPPARFARMLDDWVPV